MKVYNTLSRRKEPLKIKGNKVRMFVCGITPYDYPHIGNARTYISFDIIAKYLKRQGYKLSSIQNVTDVDDKIIAKAKEEGISPKALARRFEKEFHVNMKALGVSSVDSYYRATDHIPEIISQVERLLQKGYAYVAEDGVYYDISKFKDYGKLSGRTAEQAEDATSRIDESVQKRNRGDFALWKFSKEGEPKWKSPWGDGRPGWHIEDTAITEKHFGSQYEIHGGARDLIFPHHEAEIAQMEAISGKRPLAASWLHTGFLTVEGEKMSKSLGNFVTVQNFLKDYSPRLLRLLVLKAHYRSPVDYSQSLLAQIERELERIDEFVDRVESKASVLNSVQDLFLNRIKEFKHAFWRALEDDFNTPLALSVLFDLIREANTAIDKGTLSQKSAREIQDFLKEVDQVFSFIFWKRPKKKPIPKQVLALAEQREGYRKEGAWEKADELRQEIEAMGWIVEDTKRGPKLKPKSASG